MAHKTVESAMRILSTTMRDENTKQTENPTEEPTNSIAGFFHGWKFSLFNFSWVDILAFGVPLHRICIVEEILVELILVL